MTTHNEEIKQEKISFDKVVRNTLAESSEMTIRFINGLLDENIPLDATVEWLDRESKGFSKNTSIIADFYPRIAGKTYAIEIEQDGQSGEMAMRVFRYSVGTAILHGSRTTRAETSITFPQPCVIFLKSSRNTPSELRWNISFFDGQSITLKVPVIRLSNMSVKEISQKSLLPIGQFYLRTFETLTDKKANSFQEAATELLVEIHSAVNNNLIPRHIGLQMSDSVIETVHNALAKSRLKKEVKIKVHSNITDTYTWTDYRGYYEKREEDAKTQGITQGIAQGITQGITQGENTKAIAVAKNALDMNMSIADIEKLTGLTQSEIEALGKPQECIKNTSAKM